MKGYFVWLGMVIILLLVIKGGEGLDCGFYDRGSEPGGYIRVINLYQENNSHVELGNQSNYNYTIACGSGEVDDLSVDCQNIYVNIMQLFNMTNAHVSIDGLYNYSVCLSTARAGASWGVKVTSVDLSNESYECVLAVYQDNNSHVARCGQANKNVWVKLSVPAPEVGAGGGVRAECNDGRDNDGDGKIDREDPGCKNYWDDDESDEVICTEDWSCTSWSGCVKETQVRSCYEMNDCKGKKEREEVDVVIERIKPAEVRDCIESCEDGVKNQDETDVDCGGLICPRCVIGKSCLRDWDCEGFCWEGVCVECRGDEDCKEGYECKEGRCKAIAVVEKPEAIKTIWDLLEGVIRNYIIPLLALLVFILATMIAVVLHKEYKEYRKRKEERELRKASRELVRFVKKARLEGYREEEVKKMLREEGWPLGIVDKYVGVVFKKVREEGYLQWLEDDIFEEMLRVRRLKRERKG